MSDDPRDHAADKDDADDLGDEGAPEPGSESPARGVIDPDAEDPPEPGEPG
ncbi:hypothetical protein [Actinomarinicola tropica]|uniref:Uncharacterized protein n=1 Tax=Actinomarinicola tropica TaxID=2789776 RepID=A0A5Q2RLJ3_9ACTN|nr:hypothetical protein [Actinomarinicola tropica]QGG96713.1 hypothetical protein GH723_17310 [Actinomarinicola tropica]